MGAFDELGLTEVDLQKVLRLIADRSKAEEEAADRLLALQISNAKKLFDALSSIQYTVVSSDGKTPIESDKSLNPEISSLVFDSRDVKPGALFFALPGTHTTGNVFIPKAIENGASAVVFEVGGEVKSITVVSVRPYAEALSVDEDKGMGHGTINKQCDGTF